MTALGTVIIIMSVILQLAIFILPAISGMIVLFSAFEVNYKFGLKVYFSISVLSLMLSPDKFSSILFITLLGYYPLVKLKIDCMGENFKATKLVLKLLLFNFVVLLYYFVLIYLLLMPKEFFNFFGIYMPAFLLIIGNITFLMYDRCILCVFMIVTYKFKNKIPFKIN